MKTQSKFVALVVAGMLAAGPMLAPAFAQTASTSNDSAVQAAQTTGQQNQLIRTADEAYRALRNIQAARLAIFEGTPDKAAGLAEGIYKDLQTAQENAGNTSLPTNKSSTGNDVYVPFDMSMSLAEGFQPTSEKEARLTEANGLLASGNSKQAAEVLKLANIDVTVSAALIPINASVQHAKDAVDLISNNQFYEANLALKAIEDSVVIEAYGIDTIPVQGS